VRQNFGLETHARREFGRVSGDAPVWMGGHGERRVCRFSGRCSNGAEVAV